MNVVVAAFLNFLAIFLICWHIRPFAFVIESTLYNWTGLHENLFMQTPFLVETLSSSLVGFSGLHMTSYLVINNTKFSWKGKKTRLNMTNIVKIARSSSSPCMLYERVLNRVFVKFSKDFPKGLKLRAQKVQMTEMKFFYCIFSRGFWAWTRVFSDSSFSVLQNAIHEYIQLFLFREFFCMNF